MQYEHHRAVSSLYYSEGNQVSVLVCGPTDGHTFDYINWSLQELGIESEIIDTRKKYNEIYEQCVRLDPEFLIVPRQGIVYEQIKRVKEETDIKVYMWNTDSRGTLQRYESEFGTDLIRLFKICDTVYTVAIGEVEMFAKEGINAKWLVQGIWPGVDNKPSIKREYKHDISFLGSIDRLHETDGGRISMLRGLYTAGYDINNEFASGAEASAVYYLSRINIGHAHSPSLGENSVRDFKIMGSGGFLLTQWYRGIEEIMNIGVEMDCYKTPEECVSKCKHYFENDNIRESIAQNGYESAHDRHKYSDRIKEILRDHND